MCARDVLGRPHFRAVFLADLSGPLQLHHGSLDKVVPTSFSESLYQQLRAAGQPAELYLYPQGDHNIRVGFDEAMQRTLRFFEAQLKAKSSSLWQRSRVFPRNCLYLIR